MIDTTTATALKQSQASESRIERPSLFILLALFALGAGSLWLYFWGRDLHRFTQWIAAYIGLFIGQIAFYLAACYLVLRHTVSSRDLNWTMLVLIVFFSIGFRAVLVPQRPYLSADVYRYVWDGHVQTAGINPYRYTPDAEELNGLRDDRIFPNITADDKRWLSPYPPAAQFVFLAVSLVRSMSVTAFKAAMAWFDVIAMLALMLVLARNGLNPARAIIFAWHPLLIFEGAHSGHVESALIAFLALALLAWSFNKNALAGAALALATLVKFYPVLLLPVFLMARPNTSNEERASLPKQSGNGFLRSTLRSVVHKQNVAILASFLITIAVAYTPYVSAGNKVFSFLRDYLQEEGFIQGGARYFLLDVLRRFFPVPTILFVIPAVAFLAYLSFRLLFAKKRNAVDLARGTLILIGSYLILTTPRYAWYYAWLIPFLCLVPRVAWLYLTCASALLYLLWYTPLVYPGISLRLGTCLFLPTLALLAWERVKRKSETGATPAFTSS
jgi:alpha-1,6-mannosyltransferase